MVAALQAAKAVADAAIQVAEAATVAAAGTPGALRQAYAAEQTVKGSVVAATMGQALSAAASRLRSRYSYLRHSHGRPPPHGPRCRPQRIDHRVHQRPARRANAGPGDGGRRSSQPNPDRLLRRLHWRVNAVQSPITTFIDRGRIVLPGLLLAEVRASTLLDWART